MFYCNPGSSSADDRRICSGIMIVFLSVFLFCVLLTFIPFRWASVATALVAVFFICACCFRPPPDDSAAASRHRHHHGRPAAAAAAAAAVAPHDTLSPPAMAAHLRTFAYESARAGGSCEMCAVCIGVLQGGETVRQIPACNHVFHIGCIDMWLYSHATCPLCRAAIKPPPQSVEKAESEEPSALPLPPV